MGHLTSWEDRAFRRAFEACTVEPSEFNHRAHVRLAYVYLCDHDTDAAHQCVKRSLLSFLRHNNIDASKYHETMTRAWVMAVRHFMERTPACESAERFIECNPRILDSKIMMTHYSADVLFSQDARAKFVAPDIDPIPSYA